MAIGRNKQVAAPPWRPNFRNKESLPDIKVVRTNFLLNFVAVSVVVILLGLVGLNESRILVQRNTKSNLETSVRNLEADNAQRVRLSNEFKTSAAPLNEVIDFSREPLKLTDLVFSLAEIRPQDLVLSTVNFGPTSPRRNSRDPFRYRLTLQGNLRQASAAIATPLINSYQESLRSLEEIEPILAGEPVLTRFQRDERAGRFDFTIVIDLQPPDKK